jgi:glutamate-1-semialdehyde 2,1-aminomutase
LTLPADSFVTSAAHTDRDIEQTVAAVRAALTPYRWAIERGSVDGLLEGRPVAPAIRPFAAPRRIDIPVATSQRAPAARTWP